MTVTPGPLDWRRLVDWLCADAVITSEEAQRVITRCAQAESRQHPLVRLASVAVRRASDARPLDIEALTQWLAQRTGLDYLRIDPLRVDVAKVADALGGVEVEVPKRMVYVDNSQGLYIDLDPGLQVLKGEKLEGFLRFRHDEQGDLGRMERQRLVINQVFRKLAQPATLAQLPALLKIAGEDIDTDLSPLELTQLLGAMGHTKLSTQRLNGREYWENELSYWMPATNLQHPSGNGEIPPN